MSPVGFYDWAHWFILWLFQQTGTEIKVQFHEIPWSVLLLSLAFLMKPTSNSADSNGGWQICRLYCLSSAIEVGLTFYWAASKHYIDVIVSTMASQITNVSIVYSTVCTGTGQRKYQSSASLAFIRGIHRWPVNSPHKGSVTRKMLPFDDVIKTSWNLIDRCYIEVIICGYWYLTL